MNPSIYVICMLLAVLGRILGQSLGARKERANRCRQYRLERLAAAWRSINHELSSPTQESRRCLEVALREVELFGAPAHVNSAARAVRALDDTGADRAEILGGLLEVLRAELRREMDLSGHVPPLAPQLADAGAMSHADADESGVVRRLRQPRGTPQSRWSAARGAMIAEPMRGRWNA